MDEFISNKGVAVDPFDHKRDTLRLRKQEIATGQVAVVCQAPSLVVMDKFINYNPFPNLRCFLQPCSLLHSCNTPLWLP